ncbi:pfs domain-containing protein [Hypoxylon sp. FL1284]|nr:pfs domain-containing protein [Hypoxylon sp. FL1284]
MLPQAIPAVDGITGLLVATSRTIQEIAKLLRADEKDGECKVFYAYLTVYCAMIRDHANRINRAGISIDGKCIHQILIHLNSTVSPYHLQESSCEAPSYPYLRALNQRWERVRNDDDGSKLDFIRKSVGFGISVEERNEFVQVLVLWEEEFRAQYPDDPSQWTAEDFAPQKQIDEPSYTVWSAANSIFKALAACKNCPCSPMHDFGARLCLGTYRKPILEGDAGDVDFDIFLSMTQDWHEARVHASKEKAVRWAANSEARGPQIKSKRPQVQAMKVRQLCEPMQKAKKLTARRLEFKVTRDQLFKLQSERSQFSIDKTRNAVTLEEFLKRGPHSFTERTRRILAVLLSYAALHLNDTPWLQPTWKSSDIIFFRTPTSAIPLKPFIQTQLSGLNLNSVDTNPHNGHTDGESEQEDSDYGEIDPDDIDPDDLVRHQCPSLVTLAVMLMEVYFVIPFEMLAKKYGVEIGDEASSHTTYLDVDMVFRACRDEIPENFQFRYAVEKCLDPVMWEDEDGNKLDDQTLRIRIYQEIVRPLENELTQAYSNISIEGLDQFAQTLDFGSWDQTIPDLSQQYHAENHGELAESHLGHQYAHLQGYFRQPHAALLGYQAGPHSHFLQPLQVRPVKGPDIDYKESRFFDDETISEEHSREACEGYQKWKSSYQAVYDKFTTSLAPPCASSAVKIAVLDTGIDLSHPDIEARSENIKGKYNWLNERFRNGVHDRNGHGTFVSGILLDYAPDAHLYIAKIAEARPSSPKVIAQAINLAVDTWDVDIISMSFGFPTRDIDGYDDLEEAIMNAYSNHVLLFAAASNSGGQLGRAYPAREQNVICIHSTDANGNRSQFSPTAVPDDINLATVGEAVESAWPVHLCDDVTNPSCIKYKSGTSYATPIAAGIAAFLLQYARQYLPGKAGMLKRQKRMKDVLRRVAEKGSTYKPRDGYYFLDLSLYADSLFGKGKSYVDHVIGDLLSS